jgi:DNA (cytosine-5)-methyltransferase 1
MKLLDLFSGIGGFSLAASSLGIETVAFCEIDSFCKKVLNKNFPNVPVFSDICKLKRSDIDGTVDIITGGYPCQPFSVAGSQKGKEDQRYLWPEMFRIIKEFRPTWVIGENVGGHIKLGLDTVLEDLESEGYTTRAFSISASSIGAKHQRERVWIVGYTEHNGPLTPTKQRGIDQAGNNDTKRKKKTSEFEGASMPRNYQVVEDTRRSHWTRSEFRGEDENETRKEDANQFKRSSSTSQPNVANTDSERLQRHRQKHKLRESKEKGEVGRPCRWQFEPDVGRVAYGVPNRVDRLKSLGNAIVPDIAYYILKSIKE